MLKAVFFDLDHTLYSRELSLEKMAPFFSEAMDLRQDTAAVTRILCLGDECFYDEDYIFRGLPAVYSRITALTKLPPFEVLNRDFMNTHLGKSSVPYPFTHTVLDFCKTQGLKLGMITNGKSGMQDEKIDALKIRHFFNDIVMGRRCRHPQTRPTCLSGEL